MNCQAPQTMCVRLSCEPVGGGLHRLEAIAHVIGAICALLHAPAMAQAGLPDAFVVVPVHVVANTCAAQTHFQALGNNHAGLLEQA